MVKQLVPMSDLFRRAGAAAVYVVGSCAVALIIGTASAGEPPFVQTPSSGAVPWRVWVVPRNFDPADPWEYTHRRGELSPGAIAGGTIWNRPRGWERRASGQAAAVSPQPRIIHLGDSVRGNPIVMHLFGEGDDATLIFAAIHGNEANSAVVASRLVAHLIDSPEAWQGRCVGVIPVANPDGLAKNSRTNVNQVDVNRNFPAKNWEKSKPGSTFGGNAAESEPETRAIIRAVESLRPARIVSIHSITGDRYGNNYDGPADELARLMQTHNKYRVMKSIGYPTPGSFGSWAGVDRQIPTITLELPHDEPGPSCWERNREALLAVIRAAEVGK
jgi:murein peptide amidase A